MHTVNGEIPISQEENIKKETRCVKDNLSQIPHALIWKYLSRSLHVAGQFLETTRFPFSKGDALRWSERSAIPRTVWFVCELGPKDHWCVMVYCLPSCLDIFYHRGTAPTECFALAWYGSSLDSSSSSRWLTWSFKAHLFFPDYNDLEVCFFI